MTLVTRCKHTDRKHWSQGLCENCYRWSLKKQDPEHKAKAAAAQRARTYELRQKVFDEFGRSCVKCGFSDERALQLDHVNGGGTAERKSGYATLLLRALREPDEFQMLCANCNQIKRHECHEDRPGKYATISPEENNLLVTTSQEDDHE